MKRSTFVSALILGSMGAVAVAVKAQDKALPSFNQDTNRREPDLKDSVKGDQGEISKLVQTMMASGLDSRYGTGRAQAVGLDRSMPAKVTVLPIGMEARQCNIIYEPDEPNGNRPLCVYFLRTKNTRHDGEERYYRVSLDGRLEKVVTLKNKIDDQGKILSEGRSRVEEDITSSDIKKAFKTELTFWLKDWLKQKKKVFALTTASAATPGKPDTTSAAAAPATP